MKRAGTSTHPFADAVVDAECPRCLAVGFDGCASMELSEKSLEFTGEPQVFEGAPQCGTLDGFAHTPKKNRHIHCSCRKFPLQDQSTCCVD